jgi:hypothetical protein
VSGATPEGPRWRRLLSPQQVAGLAVVAGVEALAWLVFLPTVGVSAAWAGPLAAATLATQAAALGAVLWPYLTGRFPSPRARRATPAVAAGGLAWNAFVVAGLVVGPGAGVVAALAVVAVVPPWMRRRYAVGLVGLTGFGGLELASAADADVMIDACHARLADPALDDEVRARVVVNLGHALAVRSTITGRPDGLVEAAHRLLSVLHAPGLDVASAVRAAEQLYGAMRVKWTKSGDERGYLESLEALAGVWRRMRDPGAEAHVLWAEAQHALFRAQRAQAYGDDAVARACSDEALALARASVAAAPPDLPMAATARGLVAIVLHDRGPESLDEAVTWARESHALALRQRRAAPPSHVPALERAVGDHGVGLGGILLERALAGGPTVDDDTREAVSLLLDDDTQVAGLAAWWLAQALGARDIAGLPPLKDLPRLGRLPSTAEAFRRACTTAAVDAEVGIPVVATAWAEWAMVMDRTEEAAEALWQVTSSVADEALRRITRRSRERTAALGGQAADAGHWLWAAGRRHEAVLALEHGRTVMLTGRARYEDPDLQLALADAGEEDLWHEWVAANRRLDEVHRRQFGRDGDDLGVGGQAGSEGVPFVSVEQSIANAVDAAARRVEAAVGDPLADPTGAHRALARRIAGHPVAYVAAAGRGGYALVAGLGSEPLHVPLPALTATAVDGWARALQAAPGPSARLGGILGGLVPALAPLHAALRGAGLVPGADLTLVPVGHLALVPLQAAVELAGSAAGEVPFTLRNAPNARSALLARRIAARTSAATVRPRLAAVAAADVPGAPRLDLADVEVELVAEAWGLPITHAVTAGDVLATLAGATVWHLACHGRADLEDPLASALVLPDGEVTLADVLERPEGEHLLAVLSACETDVPDAGLPDEVLSLPGALLRAGVGGVVATHWAVEDRAAALYSVAIHRAVRCGVPPARAASEARRWLRAATHAELVAFEPRLAPAVPTGVGADRLGAWSRQRPYARPHHWAAWSYTGA